MEDVPAAVREVMTIHLVDSIPEVLAAALDETPSLRGVELIG
jgi:ATP-dependent Lon protease